MESSDGVMNDLLGQWLLLLGLVVAWLLVYTAVLRVINRNPPSLSIRILKRTENFEELRDQSSKDTLQDVHTAVQWVVTYAQPIFTTIVC